VHLRHASTSPQRAKASSKSGLSHLTRLTVLQFGVDNNVPNLLRISLDFCRGARTMLLVVNAVSVLGGGVMHVAMVVEPVLTAPAPGEPPRFLPETFDLYAFLRRGNDHAC
jgi:hypothetical protein